MRSGLLVQLRDAVDKLADALRDVEESSTPAALADARDVAEACLLDVNALAGRYLEAVKAVKPHV